MTFKSFPKPSIRHHWRPLQPGDCIDVVAPAWACKRLELKRGLEFLRQQGWRPRMREDIFSGQTMFASPDGQRLKQLQDALLAEDSKAIWCVRGGYGTLRLLPTLHRLKRPQHAKVVIGFSDITSIHLFLNGAWGWSSIHGPLLDRFGRGANRKRETRELLGFLNGSQRHITFTGLQCLGSKRGVRRVEGGIVGGNLTVLVSSLGTPSFYVPRGHLVFFEDTGERPHRVDRMLTQLRQAGFFRHAKGVIFGSMLLGHAKDRRVLWREVLPRFAMDVDCPVLFGLPVGHGDTQRPLPLLSHAELDVKKGILTVESGARS